MLLAIVCTFLLCNSLALFNNFAEIYIILRKLRFSTLFDACVEIGNILVGSSVFLVADFSSKDYCIIEDDKIRHLASRKTVVR